MAFGRFAPGVGFRTCATALLLAAAMYLAAVLRFPIAGSVTAAVSLLSLVATIRYVGVTNRRLAAFLTELHHADFSRLPTIGKLGGSFPSLEKAISGVLHRFGDLTADLQASNRYLNSAMQNVSAGVIVYDETGLIDFVNRSARRILRLGKVLHVQDVPVPSFVEACLAAPSTPRKTLAFSSIDREVVIALRFAAFRIRDRMLRIVSFQDIRQEIEETELGSWVRMMRVLNHEIMNSVTPIVSLASTAARLLETTGTADPDSMEDIATSVRTIERRGTALLVFAESYRKLYTVPVPELSTVAAQTLLTRVETLFARKFEEDRVALQVDVEPKGLTLEVDQVLIEQVLINLMDNALQADATDVKLRIGLDSRSRPYIQVRDNGAGIDPELIGNIFVPFFTTKKGGSGIGLSLSRHIMLLHHGSIDVESAPRHGATFTLRL